MYHRFEGFDPLNVPCPQHHASDFWDVLYKARQLLVSRSRDELIAGMEVLDSIAHRRDLPDPRREQTKHWAPMPYTLPDGTTCEAMPALDDVDALLRNRDRIALAEYEQFPAARWHELFALLALSYVVQAHITETALNDPARKGTPLELTDAGVEHLTRECLEIATHAVNAGEGLRQEAGQIKQAVAKRASKAASMRHAPTQALKARVIALYSEHYSKRSNREAARLILDRLIKDGELVPDSRGYAYTFQGKTAMRTEEPQHRFAVWIGEFKRSHPQ